MKRLVLIAACAAALAHAQSQPGETWTGSIDLRHRFVSDTGGLNDVYRSVVNLGEGPRLYDAELFYRSPANPYLDELTLDGGAWGGDPYNNAYLTASKRGLYDFRFDYRALAYFNNLPSYANPLLEEGLLLSQRKIDLTRRNFDAQLDIKPNARVSPFLAFYRSGGDGRGRTLFFTDTGEFPVDTDLDDSLWVLRGGTRIQFQKWSLTLEQGGSRFTDDQAVFHSGDPAQSNRQAAYFGRSLQLAHLDQRYRARGDGLFSRAVFEARPRDWIGVSGQFLYYQSSVDATHSLNADGAFVSQLFLAPYSSTSESTLGDASQPRTSGSWNTALQPTSRLRIVQSFYADRYHVSSNATLAQLLNADPARSLDQSAADRLELDYSQHQLDLIYDLTPRISLRGGHRYVWSDAQTPPPSLDFGLTGARSAGETRRHVGLAGAALRPLDAVRISVDFEASPGDKTYFRTGLMDYRKARARARWRLGRDLSLSTSFSWLTNRNDDPEIDLDYRSLQASASLAWTPNGGPLSLVADYTRSDIRSDIIAIDLPFFGRQLFDYRDRGHHGGAYAELTLPTAIQLTLGGSYSATEGSRPTTFYQPRAAAQGPLAKHILWKTEWRWYSFQESFLDLENFRTHTVSAGFQASF